MPTEAQRLARIDASEFYSAQIDASNYCGYLPLLKQYDGSPTSVTALDDARSPRQLTTLGTNSSADPDGGWDADCGLDDDIFGASWGDEALDEPDA